MITVEEQATSEQEFDLMRRKYVGGSDVTNLLNIAQYGQGCQRYLGYLKLGAEPDFPRPPGVEELFKQGHIWEPLGATKYEMVTGRKVRRPALSDSGLPRPRRHPKHPWAAVNTDRLILAGHGGVTETGDLELKSRNEGPWWRIKRLGALPGDLLQPQWSMWVTGHPWASLAELGIFGTLPLIHFDIQPDPELHTVFEREGEKFADIVWGRKQLPDPPFGPEDQRCKVCSFRMTCRGEAIDEAEVEAMRAMKGSRKNLVQIDSPQLAHTLADMDMLKAEAKVVDETLDRAKQEAMGLLGEVEGAYVKAYGKVYRIPTTVTSFQFEQFKIDYPELYEKYRIHRVAGYHLRSYPQL